MNASRLLIATACSLAVVSAATVAFAQSTTTNPTQNQNQTRDQTPSTTTPGSTMPGGMNSTTQRPYDATSQGTSTTGNAATRSGNDTLSSPADRADRADRN